MIDREDNMVCPWCKKKMEPGTLQTHGAPFFLPEGESLPTFRSRSAMGGKHAIPFGPYINFFGPVERPKAFACRDCKKLVIPFSGEFK